MKSYIITPQQQDEIKKRDFSVYTFKVGNKKYQCYSKLMFYLLSDNPEMVNRETQQVEIVDKRPILDVYANAFDEGVQTFNSDFRVDTSVLYSTNADVYIKTLIEKFNEPHTGWKWGSEEFNLIVTPTNIEKIGRLSGTRFAFEKLKKNNSSIFEKYEGKGITPPPKKHNLPTIDTNKFNSDKIYETYNNVVFKCSKGCFNALLVDGFEHKDKIEFILKGRKSTKTDKETLQYAQLRKFIETITGNKELTKDAYYQTIFGLKIKTSSYETATTLNNTFKDLKLNRLTK